MLCIGDMGVGILKKCHRNNGGVSHATIKGLLP